MKYYAVAEIEITKGDWIKSYVSDVTKMVERRGGRYLARTSKIEKVEGQRTPPPLFLIIEWPSREAAIEFYESDEYRPYRQMRLEGTSSEFLLVAGEDVNKAAQMADQDAG